MNFKSRRRSPALLCSVTPHRSKGAPPAGFFLKITAIDVKIGKSCPKKLIQFNFSV
jgi:hypothetical protein